MTAASNVTPLLPGCRPARAGMTSACTVCGEVYWTVQGHDCPGPRSLYAQGAAWFADRGETDQAFIDWLLTPAPVPAAPALRLVTS